MSASGCGIATAAKPLPPRILFVSSRTGAWALYSMNARGGDQRRFTGDIGGIEPGAEGVGIGVPSLSPDGSEVLVPQHGTTAITLATGARHPLAFCADSVVWSPDGQSLACSGRSFTSPIFVVDHPGASKRALPGTGSATPVAWSPDGQWILFSLQDGTGPDYLWRIHADGTGLKQISPYTPGSAVLWRTDGQAEFVGTRSVDVTTFEKLVVVNVTSGKAHVLRSLPTPSASAWSPDGRTLVYAAYNQSERSSAIYAVDRSGGHLRRLTPPGKERHDSSPSWSPDGKSLVFVREADSGAAQYTPEVWTMLADGSQQRQLTQAYPDDGGNDEPLWVSATVHAIGPPHVVTAPHALRVPYLVAGVTAEGARAAIAGVANGTAYGANPTPPLVVWQPGRHPQTLVGSACGSITPAFLAGGQLTTVCAYNFFDEHNQAIDVFDLGTHVPIQLASAYNANFGRPVGSAIDGPVQTGAGLVFETEYWRAGHTQERVGVLRKETLVQADGVRRHVLRSAHRLGTLVAGDRDWLVFQLAGGVVEIASPTGTPAGLLHLPALHLSRPDLAPSFLLAGKELVRLGGGHLQAWDVRSGRMMMDKPVPGQATLQAVDGGLVVYSVGPDLHLVSSAGDRVIQTPAQSVYALSYFAEPPVHAALSAAGLFFTYNVKDSLFPGRVVFIPRTALPR